ncbi:MAG: SEL1-like repeat protein [Alphaproteobacteria bacterium]|nr:SEL1-like repeat protein [Alphaproteobacteria bacterium]
MRLIRAVLALLLLVVGVGRIDDAPARIDDRQLGQLLQHFDEAALWHDATTLVPPRKWRTRPRLQIVGTPGEGLERMTLDVLEHAAQLAGLAIERAGPGEATLVVRFEDAATYVVNGRAAGCYAMTRWNQRGEIVHAELVVNYAVRPMLRQCIVHETMHAFGFPGHPHGFDSVLSYVFRRENPTALDETAYRVLYDPRLRANGGHLATLIQARQVIAERIGAVAPGVSAESLAASHLEQAARDLRRAAESGQAYAQRQLGIALANGQAMARDPAAALAWWRKAAAQGDLESSHLLGEALLGGEGIVADVVAAFAHHQRAAAGGHGPAMARVAQALEFGRGVAADRGAAAALYILAVEHGQLDIAGARDRLLAQLEPAERSVAERNARDWRPTR